jgi:hypothetical protein
VVSDKINQALGERRDSLDDIVMDLARMSMSVTQKFN